MTEKWNLIDIQDAYDRPALGNKAAGLGELKRAGFSVPEGFVLPEGATREILEQNGLAQALADELGSLSQKSAGQSARRLKSLTGDLTLPREIREMVRQKLAPGRLYAVRSSGTLEDLDDASFAGQYDSWLNVKAEEVPARILDCLRSQWKEPILHYMADRGIDPASGAMAVIIQEMVQSEQAGVLFSVNPITGDDTQVVIEVVEGLGDALVSGRAVPERWIFDWYSRKIKAPGDARLLDENQARRLGEEALEIQKLYGFPVDVEFALAGGRFYALQVRPVTKINYTSLSDQWSTADFKDGGVSAAVTKPLMGSLYEYVWEKELKSFLLGSHILGEKELRRLSRMMFGRLYWNMSVVKSAMAKVPGFKEREFDQELGISSAYPGEGMVTRWTPAAAAKLARIALSQRGILKAREEGNEALKQELLTAWERSARALGSLEGEALKKAWIGLVEDQYLKSEGSYFRQIFINTIHQSLQRDAIMKYADLATYYDLIGGLTNVSHLRPFYDLWELSRHVRSDQAALSYWLGEDPAVLTRELLGDGTDSFLPEVRAILKRYEYHSDKELDISWPDYDEDPAPFIASFRDALRLSDEYSPEADKLRVHRSYLNALESIGRAHGRKAGQAVEKKVRRIRTMLWWREEFRDISTRWYHLIRLYTKKLASVLTGEGVLQAEEDIWFLTMGEVTGLLTGRIDPAKAASVIRRSRDYHDSFRHFMSDNEVGGGIVHIKQELAGTILAAGLPASSGMTHGTARVISGLGEMDNLLAGDILVTKFTDTGWTSKFALLSGVITEFGGALSHAAVISREYGIPCIVGTKDAMARIRDGERIVMDGSTGEIRREEGNDRSL